MKRALILFILIFVSIGAYANMISFIVIETGLKPDPEKEVFHQHSALWENAFLDVFFDAGFIVSNAPILRVEKKPSGNILNTALINISDAREWGIDFVLIAQLDYTTDSKTPSEILFYLYQTSPEKKILENREKLNLSKNPRDEYEGIKTIVRGLIPYIK